MFRWVEYRTIAVMLARPDHYPLGASVSIAIWQRIIDNLAEYD
jgi:hypothetical protein